jgi:hypothetical protein
VRIEALEPNLPQGAEHVCPLVLFPRQAELAARGLQRACSEIWACQPLRRQLSSTLLCERAPEVPGWSESLKGGLEDGHDLEHAALVHRGEEMVHAVVVQDLEEVQPLMLCLVQVLMLPAGEHKCRKRHSIRTWKRYSEGSSPMRTSWSAVAARQCSPKSTFSFGSPVGGDGSRAVAHAASTGHASSTGHAAPAVAREARGARHGGVRGCACAMLCYAMLCYAMLCYHIIA